MDDMGVTPFWAHTHTHTKYLYSSKILASIYSQDFVFCTVHFYWGRQKVLRSNSLYREITLRLM